MTLGAWNALQAGMLSVPGALKSHAAESVFERASCGSSFKMGSDGSSLRSSIRSISWIAFGTDDADKHLGQSIQALPANGLRLKCVAKAVGFLVVRGHACTHRSSQSPAAANIKQLD